ncbi:MAG: aldehyde dehydrogenase family protein, partial [Akkermansiaceae bacterium]|nr:aldehyde dehydrogenase family protein [Akkermansiaceae bacterium]
MINPGNGELVGTVADVTEAETRRAIEAASAAFDGWRALTANQRSAILRNWYQLIMENQEDLAQLMTHEMGKPINEARGEAAYGASFVEWYAEEGRRAY